MIVVALVGLSRSHLEFYDPPLPRWKFEISHPLGWSERGRVNEEEVGGSNGGGYRGSRRVELPGGGKPTGLGEEGKARGEAGRRTDVSEYGKVRKIREREQRRDAGAQNDASRRPTPPEPLPPPGVVCLVIARG